jgi:hypothetical protein
MSEALGVTVGKGIVTRADDGKAPKSSAPIYRHAPTFRRYLEREMPSFCILD